MDSKEKTTDKFDTYVLKILIGFVIIVAVGIIGKTLYRQFSEEIDYESRQINGTILKLDSVGRGQYRVTIKQFDKPDTLEYTLHLSRLIEKYNIQPNDSITKRAKTYDATFYKKKDNKYIKCCEY